jgi:hypothetical protein
MRSLGIFKRPNPSSHIVPLRSTQRLTEMSTKNLPGDKWRPSHIADNSLPSVSRLFTKCWSLDISQTYGPPRLVTERAWTFIIFFGVQSHCSTPAWISFRNIIIISRGLRPLLVLLLLLVVLLYSFVYSFIVLSLLNLALCPTLPTLTYADLSGSRSRVFPNGGGGVPLPW